MDEMTENDRKQIDQKFATVNSQLQRILSILENDEAIGEDGLVKKVSKITKTLEELLLREKVYKAKATSWGIIGGAVGTAIIWFTKGLLAKLIF